MKLPKAVQSGQDLLVAGKAAGGKASALKKKHKGSEVAVGPVMEVEAMHADGLPLKLQLQVCADWVCLGDFLHACCHIETWWQASTCINKAHLTHDCHGGH